MVDSILLRKAVLADAPTILSWENDPANWSVSNTEEEYVLQDIINLIQSFGELDRAEQMRYLIEDKQSKVLLGAVDLFQIKGENASIGILVADKAQRGKGVAKKALLLLEEICFQNSMIRHLNAKVFTNNLASVALFNSCNYQKVDTSREKLKNGEYIETILFEKWLKE